MGEKTRGTQACVGYSTAQSYWRWVRTKIAEVNGGESSLLVRLLFEDEPALDLSSYPEETDLSRAPAYSCLESYDWLLELPWAGDAPELLVSSRRGRHALDDFHYRLMSNEYPAGSFMRISEDLLVASPELTFVQMCSRLSLAQCVAYGFELCGYYTLESSASDGFVASPPLTCVEKIRKYLASFDRKPGRRGNRMPRGSRKARAALELLVDYAASPREAQLAMLLCMPQGLGGYGLPLPELNGMIEIEGLRFCCDLVWRDACVVVEYQGEQHFAGEVPTRDRRKRSALEAEGYFVLQVDHGVLRIREQMDLLAQSLAECLGVEQFERSGAYLKQQILLQEDVLSTWG